MVAHKDMTHMYVVVAKKNMDLKKNVLVARFLFPARERLLYAIKVFFRVQWITQRLHKSSIGAMRVGEALTSALEVQRRVKSAAMLQNASAEIRQV